MLGDAQGPYGLAVDWWSFGCIVYEFMMGKCPFRTQAAQGLDPDKARVRACRVVCWGRVMGFARRRARVRCVC